MISRRGLMAGAGAVAIAAAMPAIVEPVPAFFFRGVPVFLDEPIDGFIVVPGWVPDLIEEVLQETRRIA